METLPNELLSRIYHLLPTARSALSLSLASHFFRSIFLRQQLTILATIIDRECGPFEDIIQLITLNESVPVHARRSAPLSLSLLKQAYDVGRVALRWEELYPFKKWRNEYASRRLLRRDERLALRRAVYRLWTYAKAFHNQHHVRTMRNHVDYVEERAKLLRAWDTQQLAHMYDLFENVLKETVRWNVCPSNGRLLAKSLPCHYRCRLWTHHDELLLQGWGDEITHYYVVEDMMKLDPQQILFLSDSRLSRRGVEAYIKTACQGEWFGNNGETFSETLAHVLSQRGEDIGEVKRAIDDGMLGIALV
ncbi:hypothetical protein K470DRAFT_261054 [Piedraia hortae CBS 480.64]|uniref:F-box domain-containing protein n=1 Tax=Piedraia hortae CBS 480.64 TaxID=1314780 RepID=A0A6A7BQX2_9PEZI|nr:hypothetical protein K470DRAFT_261054 [Piedraia hortae CBS 480.64]